MPMSAVLCFISVSLLGLGFLQSEVCAQDGHVDLHVRPVRLLNSGKVDDQDRDCKKSDNCKVHVRMCYYYHTGTTEVTENQLKDLCNLNQHEVEGTVVPIDLGSTAVSSAYDGETKYIITFPRYKRPDHPLSISGYDFKTSKLAIWFDVSHQQTIVDPRTNTTITEHRQVTTSYNVFPMDDLVPGERSLLLPLISDVNFNDGIPDRSPIGQVKFQVRVWTTCAPFYFGCTCQTHCFYNEKYRCDMNGNRVCNSDWYPKDENDKGCGQYCLALGTNKYCTKFGKYKCEKGFVGANHKKPALDNPCVRLDCHHDPNICMNSKCVNENMYNEETKGFYRCESE